MIKIHEIFIYDLKAYENNPRRISDEAIDAVAKSIQEFGFKVPVIIDSDNVIIAGHTRIASAKKLGLNEVPCIVADDLTPEQIKAFRLVDNKTSELTGWGFEKLEIELEELDLDMSEFNFDLEFSEAKPKSNKEIDIEDFSDEKFNHECPKCGFKF